MKIENLATVAIVIAGAVIGQAFLDRFPVLSQSPLIALAIGIGVSAVLGVVLSFLLKSKS
ncbi:hypothetical protein SE15_03045 [Thermanaerothrix daxensis]|uniref:Uncharacterized protein n=1 Tax=Thermanaerothrix daxensis TaxID=869279 RepID=A0A0P6Y580_9CHLR|nr:hypothetical protein [Thermanaerothrix daxensis]KPL84157.1 hypothetical protein SE15_03045 [Thermanaerothrix daxensis]